MLYDLTTYKLIQTITIKLLFLLPEEVESFKPNIGDKWDIKNYLILFLLSFCSAWGSSNFKLLGVPTSNLGFHPETL